MTDARRQDIYTGLSRVAWGFVFLLVNFNLNTLNLLPSFVGYLLMVSALPPLAEERRDLALLRPLGLLLAGWDGIQWGLALMGGDLGFLGDLALLPGLVATVAGLYFRFQLLTDLAALAEGYQRLEAALHKRLLTLRGADVVLTTALHLLAWLPWSAEWQSALLLALVPAALVLAVCIMAALFSLRKLFGEEGPSNTTL